MNLEWFRRRRSTRAVRDNRPYLVFVLLLTPALHAVDLDIPIRAGGYGLTFYEETARAFEAINPGVNVRIYGDPRIEDKIRVRVIDGNFPDAAFTPYLLWPALIRAGKVIDLTPHLEGPNWENDARWRDTFFPGALDSWNMAGRTYAVPLNYSCWTIFYNRKLFQAHGWTEPRTWDEFFALCEKISAAGVAPVATTGVYGNYPDAFLRAAAYNLLGRADWQALHELVPGKRIDPRYVRAAEILQRVTQRYTLRGWEGMTHTAAQVAFLEGRAAMTVSGSWMIREMEGKIPDDFDIGVMPFPAFPDGVTDPTTIQMGADSFFVFKTGDPERERLTIDFLRFLTSRARAGEFARQMDSPVAVRGVPLSAYSPRMQVTVRMIEQAKDAFPMPQVMMQPPTTRQALIDQRKQLMLGAITPAQFGERLEAAADYDRRRAANPDAVEYRHVTAASLLLFSIAGFGAWMLYEWRRVRRRRTIGAPGRRRPDVPDAGHFARLRGRIAVGFIGPAFALYAGLVLVPALVAFGWAFLRWDGIGERSWAGAFNFRYLLFESDTFWSALANNGYLMVVPALVVVPTALLFAAMIHRGVWGSGVFRVVLLFPNMLGGIAAALLWLNAYEPHGGLANATLVGLGNLLNSADLQSFEAYAWLAQENLYRSLIPIYLWMACGFNLILYLAAMENIDPQLYEAAEIDGASAWRQFFTITLPLIWEVIVISAVFLVIAGLNAFEMIWLLTSQDPESGVHTLGTLMVTAMFKNFQVGQATAIAVVLFILVLATTALVMRVLKRESIEQ